MVKRVLAPPAVKTDAEVDEYLSTRNINISQATIDRIKNFVCENPERDMYLLAGSSVCKNIHLEVMLMQCGSNVVVQHFYNDPNQ